MQTKKFDFYSKYEGIGELLDERKGEKEIKLTFKEIEKKVGKLPSSARKFYTWWANNQTPKAPCRHSRVWLSRGYLAKKVDLEKEEVLFVKVDKLTRNQPRAELILKAARELQEEGKKNFTRKEIILKIAKLFPKAQVKIPSLNSAIQAMIVGSKSSQLVAEAWRDTLKHVKRNYFTLTPKGMTTEKEVLKNFIRIKSDKEKIGNELEKFYNVKFYKKKLKILNDFEVPVDFVSSDGKHAVKIYMVKKFKPENLKRVFQDLYLISKSKVENSTIVFKVKKMREREKTELKKNFKVLFKGIDVYIYEKNKRDGERRLEKAN